jgi:Protein of unknown function (DUF3606)
MDRHTGRTKSCACGAGGVAWTLRKRLCRTDNINIREGRDMSTLWEMAAAMRADEAQTQNAIRAKTLIDCTLSAGERPIDLRERAHMTYWCKSLGTTQMQLYRAVAHVGPNPSAVRRFLSARFLRKAMPA